MSQSSPPHRPEDASTVHPVSLCRNPKEHLIVALDQPSRTSALQMAAKLQGVCQWVKVGLELYLASGSKVIDELQALGFNVFLDLKLYDIPNTVAGAVRSIAHTGVDLLTLHASGGPEMLKAALGAARGVQTAPKLLGVTVLTSMDAAQLEATGITVPAATQVMRLARMATGVGIPGLVCSPEEVAALRKELGPEVLLVTPGIRPEGAEVGDQKRIATPAAAMAAGASMLVVGRPITQAADPCKAAEAILKEMRG